MLNSETTSDAEKKESLKLNTSFAKAKVALTDVFHAAQLLRATNSEGDVDFSSNGLMKYFEKVMQSQIISDDTIITSNGMIVKFIGNGDCKDDKCYIQVDTNGEAGPNKVWTDSDEPNDIIILPVKNVNGHMSIETPEIYNQF